jgi:hypothetical protein
MTTDNLLNKAEIAAKLHITPGTLNNYRSTGRINLPVIKLCNHENKDICHCAYFIHESDLDAYIQAKKGAVE